MNCFTLQVSGTFATIGTRSVISVDEKKKSGTTSLKLLPILQNIEIIVSLVSLLSASNSMGFIETILEPHLRKTFSMSISNSGLCFLGLRASFTITTMISGYLVDRYVKPISVTTFGLSLSLISISFIGPVSYLHLSPRIEVSITCLIIQGAGFACIILSTFNSILQATLKIEGYSESLSTTSIVSGIWNIGYSLGNILGSTCGGILYEKVSKGHADNQNMIYSTPQYNLQQYVSLAFLVKLESQ